MAYGYRHRKRGETIVRSKHQTGSSDRVRDKQRRALTPGKRKSRTGKIYYENRMNRGDMYPQTRL